MLKRIFKRKKDQQEIDEIVEKSKSEIENLTETEESEISEKSDEIKKEVSDEIASVKEEIEKEADSFDRNLDFQEKAREIKKEVDSEIEDMDTEYQKKMNDLEEEIVGEKKSLFGRLKKGLVKTRDGIMGKVDNVLKSYRKIDEELFEDLEEVLIMADVGVEPSLNIIENVKDKVREKKITEVEDIKGLLKEEMQSVLDSEPGTSKLNIEKSPSIILVVGVNGAGKTTTIGKLSYKLKQDGKHVIIAAGDTFRAAAIEQLEEWANRSGVEIVSHQEGSDPAAVIYDGIQSAKAKKADVLICDTAGRLHNKKNLMNELNKIFRVVEKEYPEAEKEVLLVVDATTGQNAIQQAKTFKEACDITGIVLTKLDGTAKGGVVIGVQSEVKVPVKLVGVGEGIDDLQEFDSRTFVDAIFGDE